MRGAAGTAGGGAFVDDVFSTYLYRGTGANRTITNEIDLAGKGGLIWIKGRDVGYYHTLQDNVSGLTGTTNYLTTNDPYIANTTANYVTGFNNNGFNLGNGGQTNINGQEFTSWTFRRQKGFFDIVSYTGNETNRIIPHNLGCIPGLILIKCTDFASDWVVYHRALGSGKALRLDNSDGESVGSNYFNDTDPTASGFTLGTRTVSNGNGRNYVAYIFAGGASTAATARSVDFDGSSDYLSIADNSDFALGSGDFTFEAWIKYDALNNSGTGWLADWNNGALGWFFGTTTTGGVSNRFIFGWSDTGSNINTIDSGHAVKADGQFHHYSVTRSGTTLYFFVDGNLIQTWAGVTESFYNPSGAIAIGQNPDVGGSDWLLNGKISNLRLVKGTCLYTTSFRPTYEPLTNVTNTILLCCNNSSVTGSTVTPSTITAVGSPTASTDSPFDDIGGFKFGEEGNQNLIKCGSYHGSGQAGLEIDIGWEPSWLLIKVTTRLGDWYIVDSMRGVNTTGAEPGVAENDVYLRPNETGAEGSANVIDFTSTGFKVISTGTHWNNSAHTYSYVAIRRPDPLVAKPPEVGTDVFAMDTQIANGYPMYISNFVVDLILHRDPTYAGSWEGDWYQSSRFQQPNTTITNGAGPETTGSWQHLDYNNGFGQNGSPSYPNWQAWMWKRHAGCDVVCYEGNGSVQNIRHTLTKTPEMIWCKGRNINSDWSVYHKGQNGGTNPEQYHLHLDNTTAEVALTSMWNDTAPTSTQFTVGSNSNSNGNSNKFIAILFASIDGISKCGYFTGSNGSASSPGQYAQTITTGFLPRFIIIKRVDSAAGWTVLDTTRGWASGNDPYLFLNNNASNGPGQDFGAPTATGFTLTYDQNGFWNINGGKYIYYAHA